MAPKAEINFNIGSSHLITSGPVQNGLVWSVGLQKSIRVSNELDLLLGTGVQHATYLQNDTSILDFKAHLGLRWSSKIPDLKLDFLANVGFSNYAGPLANNLGIRRDPNTYGQSIGFHGRLKYRFLNLTLGCDGHFLNVPAEDTNHLDNVAQSFTQCQLTAGIDLLYPFRRWMKAEEESFLDFLARIKIYSTFSLNYIRVLGSKQQDGKEIDFIPSYRDGEIGGGATFNAEKEATPESPFGGAVAFDIDTNTPAYTPANAVSGPVGSAGFFLRRARFDVRLHEKVSLSAFLSEALPLGVEGVAVDALLDNSLKGRLFTYGEPFWGPGAGLTLYLGELTLAASLVSGWDRLLKSEQPSFTVSGTWARNLFTSNLNWFVGPSASSEFLDKAGTIRSLVNATAGFKNIPLYRDATADVVVNGDYGAEGAPQGYFVDGVRRGALVHHWGGAAVYFNLRNLIPGPVTLSLFSRVEVFGDPSHYKLKNPNNVQNPTDLLFAAHTSAAVHPTKPLKWGPFEFDPKLRFFYDRTQGLSGGPFAQDVVGGRADVTITKPSTKK